MFFAHHKRTCALLLALAFSATPALAEERDLCTDRPGLGTPACTVERGRVVVETALADWTLDKGAGSRSDTVLIGDTLVRIGITDTVELQLGWTPLGYSRERVGAVVDKATRTGDVLVGAKINLHNPDGSGLSAAILPYATLPVGRQPIGSGDWGGGVIVPLSYDLSDKVSLQAAPEINAAVDADGDGRHLAYGGTLGVGLTLTDALSTAIEVQAIRDRDPSGHGTEAYGGLSFAYQTSKDFQLDIGSNIGLNHASSDFELYAGVSKRF